MHEWTLADELALQPVNMARVALICAQQIAYPHLSIPSSMQHLAALAAQALPFAPEGDGPLVRGALLAECLFERMAFRGNEEAYTDPRNSFLNDVLERKLGLPITLSILYVEIARRLGIPAFGVGMPGHFIVGVSDGEEIWYFDPFFRGGRLSLNECARLVERSTGYAGPFQTHWLAPADPGAITARLLNNLRAHYAQQGAWDAAIRVIELLRQVQPGVPEHYRDLGLIHYRRGATGHAAQYLEAYLRLVPDAEDAPMIREGIAGTLDAWARLN
jgi:regulator of sirC expression with transglutaminase-like and TPR domain